MFKINLNKKFLFIVAFSVFIIFIISIVFLPFVSASKTLKDDMPNRAVAWEEDRITDSKVVLCSFNLLNPEYVLIYKEDYNGNDHYNLDYYEYSRDSLLSYNWNIKYNGGIGSFSKNASFSKLSEMVEDDCNQFKQNRNKSEPDSDEITWRYYPPQTDEEIREEEERLEAENNERFNGYTSDQITKMIQDNYDSFSTETQEKIEEAPYTGGMQVWADCLAEYGIIDAE